MYFSRTRVYSYRHYRPVALLGGVQGVKTDTTHFARRIFSRFEIKSAMNVGNEIL